MFLCSYGISYPTKKVIEPFFMLSLFWREKAEHILQLSWTKPDHITYHEIAYETAHHQTSYHQASYRQTSYQHISYRNCCFGEIEKKGELDMRKYSVAAAFTMSMTLAMAMPAFARSSAITTPVTTGTEVEQNAQAGSTATVTFPKDASATAGLPAETVNQINAINTGSNLAQSISNVEENKSLEGYYALGTTQAAVILDRSGKAAFAETLVTVYVPNLTNGLGTVQVLFYNNETGRWELLTPESQDLIKRTVKVRIKNSGTLSVVYKK